MLEISSFMNRFFCHKDTKMISQNGVGSIPVGILMSNFRVMFPAVKKQFSIKCSGEDPGLILGCCKVLQKNLNIAMM